MAECRTPPRARTAPAVILMLTLPLPLPPPPLLSALLTAPRASLPIFAGACRAACRLAVATGVSGGAPATAPFPTGAAVATVPACPFGAGDGMFGDAAVGSADCVPLAADSSARRFCRERCTSWNRASHCCLVSCANQCCGSQAFVDNGAARASWPQARIRGGMREVRCTAPHDAWALHMTSAWLASQQVQPWLHKTCPACWRCRGSAPEAGCGVMPPAAQVGGPELALLATLAVRECSGGVAKSAALVLPTAADVCRATRAGETAAMSPSGGWGAPPLAPPPPPRVAGASSAAAAVTTAFTSARLPSATVRLPSSSYWVGSPAQRSEGWHFMCGRG